jgi:hypothetical protein
MKTNGYTVVELETKLFLAAKAKARSRDQTLTEYVCQLILADRPLQRISAGSTRTAGKKSPRRKL